MSTAEHALHRAQHTYAALPQTDAELLKKFGPLIDRVTRRMAARLGSSTQADELWSVAALGLLDAARRFDGSRAVKFETFAEHRIRGAILDEVRRLDHLPRRLRADTEKVQKGKATLQRELGREPTQDELAEKLAMPVEEVAELELVRAPPVPLEWALEVADDGEGSEGVVDKKRAKERLQKAIEGLNERLQMVLSLYYVEEFTFKEIGKLLQVSEARVCQLHADAVSKLRTRLSEEAHGEAA